jgi:WhiB family redox-sensing transcriptional regulator
MLKSSELPPAAEPSTGSSEPSPAVTVLSSAPRPGEDHVAASRAPLNLDDLLAVVGLTRPAWMRRAACRGEDLRLFFPGRTGAARTLLGEARAVCSTCPVVDACRDYAVDNLVHHGVWGGTSERQRRQIRRDRREPAA